MSQQITVKVDASDVPGMAAVLLAARDLLDTPLARSVLDSPHLVSVPRSLLADLEAAVNSFYPGTPEATS